MNTVPYVALLLGAPFAAFLLLILGRTYMQRIVASSISILSCTISFLLSSWLFLKAVRTNEELAGGTYLWFHLGDSEVSYGFSLEPLQLMMLVLISFVSLVVQIYSIEYMKDDKRIAVYYAYLSFFTGSMLGLVLSPNLLQIYFFWELVGVSSFLLIGFWYFKTEAKKAAKKAFIVTRVGDIGFFIALGLTFWQIKSFELAHLYAAIEQGVIAPEIITIIALGLFVGAVGKSGQLPLHTWLPDAMEGPTPVSALIHAATMVAAGVYLVAFTYPVFEASPFVLEIVAYVGAITVIFAAIVALGQVDLKRILAYSTISQLGYMMLALGVGGYVQGAFHLLTHAFFKALLFLAAGAVIIASYHHQELHRMGGLWKREKAVGICFLIGCLAISGIPPLAGFFSKDEILGSVYQSDHPFLFVLALFGAFLTALYMFRLFFTVFTGEQKREEHERVGMTLKFPLYILSIVTIGSGFFQFPKNYFAQFLGESEHVQYPLWLPMLTVGVSLLGILVAYLFYCRRTWSVNRVSNMVPSITRLIQRKFYVDELYQLLFFYPLKGLGWLLGGWDRFVIGGIGKGSVWIVQSVGRIGSILQNGQVQRYLLVSLIGVVIIFLGLTAGRLLP